MNFLEQYYFWMIVGVIIIIGAIGVYIIQSYIKKMHTAINLYRFIWEQLILEPIIFIFRWFPGGWGIVMRTVLYKILLKKMGKKVVIRDGVKISFPENVEIDDFSGLNDGCFIEGGAPVKIGKWVRFGPRVSILTMNHNFERTDIPIKEPPGLLPVHVAHPFESGLIEPEAVGQ